MAEATPRRICIEVEELLMQPGTYFNPQTEVLVVVDDSTSLDQEVFNMEAYEGADWVRISDEVPVDEDHRDRLLEHFQTHYHPGADAARSPRPRSSRATTSSTRTRTARSRGARTDPMLEAGEQAPDFTLPDQDGDERRSRSCRGETVVLYFYPRADTPGCTTQACGVRDRRADYESRPGPRARRLPDPVERRRVRRQVRPRLHPARRRRPRGRRRLRHLGREVDVRRRSTGACSGRPS